MSLGEPVRVAVAGRLQRVTIIGAGATACACGAYLVGHGFSVCMFNRWEQELAPIRHHGGVRLLTEDGPRLFPLEMATTDLEEAVSRTDLILVATLVSAQPWVIGALAKYIDSRIPVVFLSGSLGSLEAARVWREKRRTALPLVGETSTMPQSARLREPGMVVARLPVRMKAAAFPAERNAELLHYLSQLYEIRPGVNVLDTALDNLNLVLHPGPMVLNMASIERRQWQLSILTEGMTESVRRALSAADQERALIRQAFGLPVNSIEQLYQDLGIPLVIGQSSEPMGYKDRSYERYIDEDVPYGSMLMSALGDLVGVDTPVNDAINLLAGILRARDYSLEARTLARLGIDSMTADQVGEYVATGMV